MNEIEYAGSEPTGHAGREGIDAPDGVHVRQEDRGVMHYAVFDGEERVSDTVGPLDEDYIVVFFEAYCRAARKYRE